MPYWSHAMVDDGEATVVLTVSVASGKMVFEPPLNRAGSRKGPNNCQLTVTIAHAACSGSWP
jgi:hypothetical protein